jgi:hypothetical protein
LSRKKVYDKEETGWVFWTLEEGPVFKDLDLF